MPSTFPVALIVITLFQTMQGEEMPQKSGGKLEEKVKSKWKKGHSWLTQWRTF